MPLVPAVRVLLNHIADNKGLFINSGISPDEAKLALHLIESQQLVIGAMRLVLDNPNPSHPNNVAARDHAKKLLDLHDAIVVKRTAPNPVGLAPAKNPVEDQDVADLV